MSVRCGDVIEGTVITTGTPCSEQREAIVSTFAVTGEMALKSTSRGTSGVTVMRLSVREASCSVLLSG